MKKLITIILALCNAIVLYPQVIHTSSSGSMDVYADNPGDDEGYHIINVPGEDFLKL